MFDDLNDSNFKMFAMKYYENVNCTHEDEFNDDLKRIHYIKRLFKKYISRTPNQYYLKLRLERAQNLLMQTSMSILSVALASGFTSSSHFSKCYKLEFNITPFKERGFSNKEL